MTEERTMILKMLAEGKISVEEAEALLDALGEVPLTEDAQGSADPGHEQRGRERTGRSRHRRERCWPFFDFDVDFQDMSRDFQGMARHVLRGLREGLGHGVKFGDWFESFFGSNKSVDERSFSVSCEGVEKLKLDNRWGKVSISDTNEREISIKAEITAWGPNVAAAQQLAQSLELKTQLEGSILRITADSPEEYRRYRIDYEIVLPKEISADIGTRSGNIACHGRAADIRLSTFSGDVTASDVKGNAGLRSKSGNVQTERTEGDLRLNTLSGDVKLADAKGSLSCETKSGDVAFDQVEGPLKALTLSGSVEGSSVDGDVSAESKSGDIRLSDCRGRIHAKALSGDVEMRGMVSPDVSAQAISGDLDIELHLEEDGQVALRTTDGDIALKLPDSAKAHVTAKTLSGVITCELPLTALEQDKKHVQGILNEDRGRVVVSATSGDIVLQTL